MSQKHSYEPLSLNFGKLQAHGRWPRQAFTRGTAFPRCLKGYCMYWPEAISGSCYHCLKKRPCSQARAAAQLKELAAQLSLPSAPVQEAAALQAPFVCPGSCVHRAYVISSHVSLWNFHSQSWGMRHSRNNRQSVKK